MKKIMLEISGAISLILFLILLAVSNHMAGLLDTQQMAERWSKEKNVAQISCFFSTNAQITENTIKGFEYSLDSALKEASITLTSDNPSARLWVDAYSAGGTVSLSNGNRTLDADAVGIGGDFFLFHPLKLINGSFFSGNDLMQDYCILDEDGAWQLFGSNDVAGMTVYVQNVPHIVSGVIKRPEGRLEDAAGLEKTLVYVSYDTLTNLGMSSGINHYEIVMPNPVSGFAYKHVMDHIGVEETEIEIIENTSRYSLLNRLKVIGAFGIRSMNGKAMIYPYWENMARGYEDIIAALTVFMLLCLSYPVVLYLVLFIIWWRHKKWTLKDVWNKLKSIMRKG